jgi:transposase InsO family protein
MGINEVVTAPRSPWQNAYVERLIGSIRRECLDHIIIFNEHHLRRILSSYFQYHHQTRTHLSLAKDCPQTRPISQPTGARLLRSQRSAAYIIATKVAPRDLLRRPNRRPVSAWGTVPFYNCIARMQWRPEPMHGAQVAAATNVLFN